MVPDTKILSGSDALLSYKNMQSHPLQCFALFRKSLSFGFCITLV